MDAQMPKTTSLNRIAKKVNDQLIRDFTDDDVQDLDEYKKTLEETYFDKQNPNDKYELTKLSEINNNTLNQIYYKRLKEISQENVKNKKKAPAKRKAFYVTTDEDEVKDIAANGFKCKESAAEIDNLLGQSRHGVHFSKHIDLILNYQYSRNFKQFYVILVEIISANVCFIRKIPVASNVEPNTEGNAAVTGLAPSHFPLNKPDLRYKHSMIFTYDYEDYDSGVFCGDLLDKPRTILPLAIFKYEIKNPFHYDKTLFRNKKTEYARNLPRKVNSTQNLSQQEDLNVLPTQFVNKSAQFKAVAPPLTDFITITSKPKQPQPPTVTQTIPKVIENPLPTPSPIVTDLKAPAPSNGSLPGHFLNLNFVPAPPPPPQLNDESTTEDEEVDSEDEYIDPYLVWEEEYGDLIDDLYIKPSRWRLYYERTGKVDFKFKGCKKMGCQIEDICKSKLKFVDESKTQLNVKNSTNNLILMYKSKKLAVTAPNATKQTATALASSKISSKANTDATNQLKPQLNSKPGQSQSSKSATSLSSQNAASTKKPLHPTTTSTQAAVTVKQEPKVASNSTQSKSTVNTTKSTNSKISMTPDLVNLIADARKMVAKSGILSSSSSSSANKSSTEQATKNAIKKTSSTNVTTNTPPTSTTTSQTNTPKQPKSNSTTPNANSGLSSEMTSLERRLLSMDKNKKTLINKPSSTTASSSSTNPTTDSTTTVTNLKNSNTKSNDLEKNKKKAEELKKMLKENEKNKTQTHSPKTGIKNECLTPTKNLAAPTTNNSNSPLASQVNKRKKSFWEPDSDSEYDKIKKIRNTSKESSQLNNIPKLEDDYDGDEDIVIVSKKNLNLPPIQYSKPFYDTNIKGFETELRKITNNSPQFAKIATSNQLIPATLSNNNLITTITKSPIKTASGIDASQQQNLTKEEIKLNRRLNLANRGNRQRFVHHITTSFKNYANNGIGSIQISPLDVDCLKMLNIHTVNIVGGGGLKSEWSCQEIHAGGFSCIEEHKFQYTSSFLRRAQSFNFNLSLMSGFDSESSMSSDSARYFNNKSGIVNPLNMSQSCSNIFSRSVSTNELNHDQTLTNNRTPESNSNPTNNYLNNKKISLNDYVSLRAKSSSQLSSTSNQTSKQSNELNTNGNELVSNLKQEPLETIPTDTATAALVHHSPKVLIKAEPQVTSPKRSKLNKKLPSLSLIDELKKRMNPKANKENNVGSYGNSFDDEDDENDEEEEEKNSTESDKDENKSRKRHHSKSKSKSKHRHKKKSMKSKSKKKKRQSARTSDESDSEPTRSRRHHHHHKRKKNSNSANTSASNDSSIDSHSSQSSNASEKFRSSSTSSSDLDSILFSHRSSTLTSAPSLRHSPTYDDHSISDDRSTTRYSFLSSSNQYSSSPYHRDRYQDPPTSSTHNRASTKTEKSQVKLEAVVTTGDDVELEDGEEGEINENDDINYEQMKHEKESPLRSQGQKSHSISKQQPQHYHQHQIRKDREIEEGEEEDDEYDDDYVMKNFDQNISRTLTNQQTTSDMLTFSKKKLKHYQHHNHNHHHNHNRNKSASYDGDDQEISSVKSFNSTNEKLRQSERDENENKQNLDDDYDLNQVANELNEINSRNQTSDVYAKKRPSAPPQQFHQGKNKSAYSNNFQSRHQQQPQQQQQIPSSSHFSTFNHSNPNPSTSPLLPAPSLPPLSQSNSFNSINNNNNMYDTFYTDYDLNPYDNEDDDVNINKKESLNNTNVNSFIKNPPPQPLAPFTPTNTTTTPLTNSTGPPSFNSKYKYIANNKFKTQNVTATTANISQSSNYSFNEKTMYADTIPTTTPIVNTSSNSINNNNNNNNNNTSSNVYNSQSYPSQRFPGHNNNNNTNINRFQGGVGTNNANANTNRSNLYDSFGRTKTPNNSNNGNWPVVPVASSSAIAAAAAKAFTNLSGVDPSTVDPSMNEFLTENFKMALEMMPFMNNNSFSNGSSIGGVANGGGMSNSNFNPNNNKKNNFQRNNNTSNNYTKLNPPNNPSLGLAQSPAIIPGVNQNRPMNPSSTFNKTPHMPFHQNSNPRFTTPPNFNSNRINMNNNNNNNNNKGLIKQAPLSQQATHRFGGSGSVASPKVNPNPPPPPQNIFRYNKKKPNDNKEDGEVD